MEKDTAEKTQTDLPFGLRKDSLEDDILAGLNKEPEDKGDDK